ncbi:MAG TPA: N-6 DNA methylase [Niabella sp.]|nr:N-6 DNA methylase [Niabella sp.]
MKYNDLTITVPADKRQSYNKKITALIHSGNMQGITAEEVFNLYSGKGGLHGFKFNDFDNYYTYSLAKKEVEQGQFFTPPSLCRAIMEALQPQPDFLIADLTCGTGNFFNYLPREQNIYGCELDSDAFAVCRYLYPQANLTNGDFLNYRPEAQFDLIVGNPPFNLRTHLGSSQFAYIHQATGLLQYGGLLAVIVPLSFLADDFQDSHNIEWLNEQYNFITQCKLSSNAFDVAIATKLLLLQRKGVTNSNAPYTPNSFTAFDPQEIYTNLIVPLYTQRKADSARLHLLAVQNSIGDDNMQYTIKRRLWHIKENKNLREKYHATALAKLNRLKTQRRPEDVTLKEWEKIKLTPQRILRWIEAVVKKQNAPAPRKITRLVKTNYGLRNKAYDRSLSGKDWQKSVHDLLLNGERFAPFTKLYDRKVKALALQNTPFIALKRDNTIDEFLNKFTLTPVSAPGTLFPTTDAPEIRLNDMQKRDLGLLLQKRYALLAWEQGGGKSVAGMVWLRYLQGKYRNAFIVAPALAINTTWKERLSLYGFDYILIESITDVNRVRPGQIVLISYDRLVTVQRFVKNKVKRLAYKVALLVDESDELTNAVSHRTRAAINCFSKASYKLLTTGTTTRNNINELYSQLELLYNNSTAFTCWANSIYMAGKEGDIIEQVTHLAGYPFPAYRGATLFKACFCPQKSTVFGIKKDTQDIYNAGLLKDIIDKTIITRKFEEITGEKKYSIHNHTAQQNPSERKLYELLLKEFLSVCYNYYSSTGNARKDAALRLMRQIKALIKATSVPHLMPGYEGDHTPGKYHVVAALLAGWENELVTIGTIFKSAARDYLLYLAKKFTARRLYYIDGEDSVPKRKKTLEAFHCSGNGILVCTQQSLKSSVNIPYCNKCIIESLQWNIPRISQFYFRFIRFDSTRHTQVHFVNYENTIELNLMALLMAKEKLNDFIKTTNETTTAAIYEEFGIDLNILDSLIQKSYDAKGKLYLSWGKQNIY